MARIFICDGREHEDPDPARTVEEVRTLFAEFYGEVANATTKESKQGANTVYEFVKQVGTKGRRRPGRHGN